MIVLSDYVKYAKMEIKGFVATATKNKEEEAVLLHCGLAGFF